MGAQLEEPEFTGALLPGEPSVQPPPVSPSASLSLPEESVRMGELGKSGAGGTPSTPQELGASFPPSAVNFVF